MLKIYDEQGYIDIPGIAEYMRGNGITFCAFWAGRGTGKTFGEFKESLIIHPETPFIYLRRTKEQVKMLSTDEYNPVNPINRVFGTNYCMDSISKDIYGFYKGEMGEDGIMRPAGKPYGTILALSQIAGMRGFDASDVEVIYFDEFIPEQHERPIKDEAAAFFNAYETIARNRELDGKPAPICIMTANSNNINNPIFLRLKVVTKALELEQHPTREYSIMKDRGLMLITGKNSPISERKKDTALYKLVGKDSDFTQMSIANRFTDAEVSNVRSRPLKEYRPVVTVGEITIYRHKSDMLFYATTHRSGNPPTFDVTNTDLTRFKRNYRFLWGAHIAGRIDFEEYVCKSLFEMYFK